MDLVDGDDLALVLKSEIKSKQQYLEETLLADFAFTILDNDDLNCITLTREFDGEKIDVLVNKPQPIPKYYYDDDNNNLPLSFNLVVNISKKKGTKSSFNVPANPAHEITIESMSVTVPTSDRWRWSKPAEYTVDKEGNMRWALREYLKTRGIKKSSTDFLYEYMLRRAKWPPTLVMKNLHKFIKE